MAAFIVDTVSDISDPKDGRTTLREALALADASAGADTVTFAPALTAGASVTIALAAELVVNGQVTVSGPGPNLLTVSGDFLTRVISVSAGANVAISGVAISNGRAAQGAGVLSSGTLALDNCRVSGNSANPGPGGGVCNNLGASLTLTSCSVFGNQAQNSGGGIYASAGSTTTVVDSCLSSNSAQVGGGIDAEGTVSLFNSTFAINTGYVAAGAIQSGGTLALTNCTVADNRAPDTGGLRSARNSITLINTIIACNGDGASPGDISGAVNGRASRFNLIGPGGSGGLVDGSAGNKVGVADPKLSPLGNYGGPTQTIAVHPTSPARDAGNSSLAVRPGGAALATDQRGPGFKRLNGAVDIGAFEIQPPPAASVVARHVFYNNSVFDGHDPAVGGADDAAIAPDRPALRPGQLASSANVTGYSRGLNGVMVDVRGLNPDLTVTAADFLFKAGAGDDPSAWAAAPAPDAVDVRRGAGEGGSDRVTITWPDGAIANQWLEVTVLNTYRTDLPAPDVFYFGNLVGETANNSAVAPAVNALDLAQVKTTLNFTAPVTFRPDLNHDGRVNALDLAVARRGVNGHLPAFTPYADPLAYYVDLDRSGTFEPRELVFGTVDIGTLNTAEEGFRIVNTGTEPVVLDGELVLEARKVAGPGFSFHVPATPQPVIIDPSGSRERVQPDGSILRDRVITFHSPADPSQPGVLQPGEGIQFSISSGGITGAAAGSGACTRRGKRIRFTGFVV